MANTVETIGAPSVIGAGEIARRAGVQRILVPYFAMAEGVPIRRCGQFYLFHEADAERLVDRLKFLHGKVNQMRDQPEE